MGWAKLIHRKVQKEAEPLRNLQRRLRPRKGQHSLLRNSTR